MSLLSCVHWPLCLSGCSIRHAKLTSTQPLHFSVSALPGFVSVCFFLCDIHGRSLEKEDVSIIL